MNCVSLEYHRIHQVVMCGAVTDMFISCAVASVVVTPNTKGPKVNSKPETFL